VTPADDRAALASIAERLPVRAGASAVLTVAGPVAVGKSTVAAHLAAATTDGGASAAVVSTDGFLHPNDVLAARGLLDRKGIPATHDLDALAAVLDAARHGVTPLVVPLYSHERYDVADEPLVLDRPDVLVVEGVVALQRQFGDLAVYVDADDADVERWYVERFVALVAEAADDPASFYRAWVGDPPEAVEAVARAVWQAVNQPNLDEHIRPCRDHADVVVVKGPDHRILEVRWASGGAS